ncbi:MAG: carboxyl transferase domain-containing protein [Ignavibacteriaceae bacterium]
MSIIGTPVKENETYLRRQDNYKNLLRKLEAEKNLIKFGGGKEAIEKHKKKGKLTARERIMTLVDDGTKFYELGTFAAHNMYTEYGGAPSSGTIFGIGKINNKFYVIVANDATVKAGAWFPITVKKNLRAQEITMDNYLPVIYLVDSAGVFLPLQDEIFPDKEHFGRIFRNSAKISSMGIPQIAAIMGPCIAGGAYLPIMSDEALIVEGEGSVFLAGSHLVKAAIGEVIDNENLGGARVQSNISGVTDYRIKNDQECLSQIKKLTEKFGEVQKAGFNRTTSKPPLYSPEEIYGYLPEDTLKPYDMFELISRIVDNSEIDEYKAGYGKTLITCYARIDGWAVGIVANQRNNVKTETGELQVGGVIYSDSADKAARFIMNCNQRKIPLIFLQDVTGFMVGSRAEHGGIIKDGAKMVNAVANSVIPKITIIIGNSFGAGNYAMCGRAYDPRFIFAYPNAKIAVMGSAQASSVLLDIKLKQVERDEDQNLLNFGETDRKKLLADISESYDKTSTSLYAAARMWIDEIIDPALTREYISLAIEVANNNHNISKFNVGVIQT